MQRYKKKAKQGTFLSFRFMREIHNVVAVAVHHNGVAQSLVERSLPHLRVGVGLPAQSLAGETGARHIENAHLLARERGESRVAGSWNEAAVIAQHDGKQAKFAAVAGQKEDVAKRVILTQSRGSDVCYAPESVAHT